MLTRRCALLAMGAAPMPARGAAPVAELTVSPQRMLACGALLLPCVVGRSGIRRDKREGDGATPSGRYALRRVLFRPDRLRRPETALPTSAIAPQDGWCTEPGDAEYNRQVRLPRAGAHEELWRRDGLYDVIVVIGYNDAPAAPSAGSAIFLHASRPGMTATDGCVAIPLRQLLDVVAQCGPETVIAIAGP